MNMKKASSRTTTSSQNPSKNKEKNSNYQQPQNKSALKLQKTNNISPARNTTVRKSQNHISRPSVVQKRNSSYFKRLEQAESLSSGSLSQQQAEELTHKFETLSRSIVELARSRSPLGVRSLESLLTREISGTLGPALNHPKFSQGFMQATRALLDSLASDYESGKVSPSLIRPDRNHIPKADSSTTLCYRDKYFKELVISMLQSFWSDEEEVVKKPVLSAESQERIQAIRNGVRAELGIKPEVFSELEVRVAELRKSMSKSGIKMTDKDLKAEAKAIAEHLEYLKIPKSARDALRISCGGQRSPSTETIRDTSDKTGESKESSSRIHVGTGGTKNSRYDFKNSGLINTNDCASDGSEVLVRIDPLASYSRKFDIESAFDDDDDTINEEETKAILEAFKADIENRNRARIVSNENNFGVYSKAASNLEQEHSNMNLNTGFLEQRDIEEYILASKQPSDVNKLIKRFHKINNLDFCSPCLSVLDDIANMGQDFSTGKVVNYKAHNPEKSDLSKKTAMLDEVRSQIWLREAELADEIIKEMQIEFDKFKVLTEDAFEELKAVSGSLNNEQLLQSEVVEGISQYSVKDFSFILHKISKHIHLLPTIFDLRNPRFSEHQKKQAVGIVSVLEKCFQINEHSSLATSSDPLFPLNDTIKLTLSIKNVLLAFSNLGEIINQLPSEMKKMPISILNPPQTLMKTLTVIFSTEYFKDCFPPVETHSQQQHYDDNKLDVVKSLHDLSIKQPEQGNMIDSTKLFGQINRNTQISSNKISSDVTAGNKKHPDWFGNKNLENKPDVSPKTGSSLGYSSSNITIQNLSDIFLHISTLLNDVPKSFKAKKFMSLNPPDSLCQAISILYCSDDAEILTEYEKKKSFDSLTVQNTSDLFLTLSSTFHKVPERVKNLVIKDLDPPKSLTKAIHLLASLSNSFIEKCSNQENDKIPEVVESQEKFFDAVDSI